jgi:hypothetical protein
MASHPSVLLEEASLFFGLACFDRGGELLGFGMAREAQKAAATTSCLK